MSIYRFNRDFSYDFSISPQGYNYNSMTKKEAEEHFNWFLNIIPFRIAYLNSFCGDSVKLDYSYESLIDLWKFFLNIAKIERIPHQIRKELTEKHSKFGDSFIGTHQLSVSTEYLVKDIGIYLSEVFKKTSCEIYWHFSIKPKSYFFVNRPMLAGFVDISFNPPFLCECDPIHLVGVQAAKLLRNGSNIYDLYNVALIWKQNIRCCR